MNLNKNENILLVGEANFSFTLSLLTNHNYEPKYITTSCYEATKEDLYKKYGQDIIDLNLNLLLNKFSIEPKFGIDACNLKNYFSNDLKFNQIVFMFPHVSGRSNLKKNRELIENFFKSSRDVLNSSNLNSNVIVTLANGQGGTKYELDECKRLNKDSWQINQIAQKYGYILSECNEFKEDDFDYYKSTGYRNQSKSFKTKSGLIHKFSLSLPLNEFDFFKLKHYFSQLKSRDHYHPLVQFKYALMKYIRFNFSFFGSHFFIDECEFNLNDKFELNNLKYETSISYTHDDDSMLFDVFFFFQRKLNELLNKLNITECESQYNYINCIHRTFTIAYKSNIKLVEIDKSWNDVTITTNTSYILKLMFNLNDIRLLFSDDKRLLIEDNLENKVLKLSHIIRPYSIDTLKWYHDLTFWYKYDQIDAEFKNEFLNLIRTTCFNLVRSIQLIDYFKKEAPNDGNNNNEFLSSYCFRLEYESCDRSLDWDTTTRIQLNLREKLSKLDRIILR